MEAEPKDSTSDVLRLISFLYTHNTVHYPNLMSFLNVSRKKVKLYLDQASALLAPQNIQIVRKRNKGIYLDGNLEQITNSLGKKQKYLSFDANERRNLILFYFLMNDKPINLEKVCEKFFISKSTLDRDIKAIKDLLKGQDISFKSTKNGIVLNGNERRKRDIASTIVSQYTQESIQNNKRIIDIPTEFTDLLDKNDLIKVQYILNQVQAETKISFTESQYQSLLLHICISTVRIKGKEYLQTSNDSVTQIEPETKKLVQLLEKAFDIFIPKSEEDYLNIHILAAKQGSIIFTDAQKTLTTNDNPQSIADFLKHNIYSYDEKLIEDLTVHLSSSMGRLKLGLRVKNPYTKKIIRSYPQSFELAYNLGRNIASFYLVEFDKDEIAYLALHFQAYLERKKKLEYNTKLKIVIVYSTGMGTARLLSQHITNTFGELVEITNILSVSELFEKVNSLNEDLIISTVPIEIKGRHVITMEPFFSDQEKIMLEQQIKTLLSEKRIANTQFMD
ncbi:PRD domain-containing protein [Lactobacillus sp. ESL0791]|uniref:BglG family transcription antiterminator n=1 Tax=Lactobacillus sp. ESL0791 TaxID=2983234 RepID=UPI0023F9B303|nr:PRD domain-containing protein [Lactobacillus sp. ESL0791]MDF7639273.1 PRD domain-containing protein [Lactobacillus sp. ESL0791]